MQRSMDDRHLLDLLTNTEGERDRIDDIEAGQLAEELIAGTHRGILAGRRLAQQLAADGHDRMRIPFSDLLRRANGFAHEPIRLIGRKIMAQIAKEFPLRTRSEEHTSELPSLMRTSYAVIYMKKKNTRESKE